MRSLKRTRTYSAYLLLILFSCYYTSINFFGHTHITGGISVVHSHLGGNSEHNHSDSQFAVIDLLSNFQSEGISEFYLLPIPLLLLSDISNLYNEPFIEYDAYDVNCLRGPPQC